MTGARAAETAGTEESYEDPTVSKRSRIETAHVPSSPKGRHPHYSRYDLLALLPFTQATLFKIYSHLSIMKTKRWGTVNCNYPLSSHCDNIAVLPASLSRIIR